MDEFFKLMTRYCFCSQRTEDRHFHASCYFTMSVLYSISPEIIKPIHDFFSWYIIYIQQYCSFNRDCGQQKQMFSSCIFSKLSLKRSGKFTYCVQSLCTTNVFLHISKAMLSHLKLPKLKLFHLILKLQ